MEGGKNDLAQNVSGEDGSANPVRLRRLGHCGT
jgi:hypothetical protein